MTWQERISIYFWSIRYLKPMMIYWRVHRAVKGVVIRLLESSGTGKLLWREIENEIPVREFPLLASRYYCELIDLPTRSFSFLHQQLKLPDDRAERLSAVASMPLLWQFHFGYHDYLLAIVSDRSVDGSVPTDKTVSPEKSALDEALAFTVEWKKDYPVHGPRARSSAWHPYVLSIRIESWIRLHALCLAVGIDAGDSRLMALRRGIEQMTRVLLRNLERGTLANHLLRNIKALVFAGLFLDDTGIRRSGSRALKLGLRLLERELPEQVLDDGCHFERSPMYHVSVMNDVLDMAETLHKAGNELSRELRLAVERMTAFLHVMRHPDGEIPFFNDSTRSFFLRTPDVLRRGVDLCGELGIGLPSGGLPLKFSDIERSSGLYVHSREDLFVVFDAGPVGPDYQPGHAHCDTLSFEVSLDGNRCITDTGVFHYRESKERVYSRSTAAHNTVQIDGQDQSEVWKSFRVGRRAKIKTVRTYTSGSLSIMQAAHDGYERLEEGLVHERALVFSDAHWMCVIDWLHGNGTHRYDSRLHFHPHTVVRPVGGSSFTVRSGQRDWHLQFAGREAAGLQSTHYYPEFGAKKTRPSVVLSAQAEFPLITAALLVFAGEGPRVVLDTEGLTAKILLPEGEVEIFSIL